jgi:cyanophycin synthetase
MAITESLSWAGDTCFDNDPVLDFRHLLTFYGPSPFATEPVVIAGIALRDESEEQARLLLQGCQRLRYAFPEWIAGQSDDNVSVVETIALTAVQWALGALNEIRGYIRDSGSSATPDGALLWVGYHQPEVSLTALETALRLIIQAMHADFAEDTGPDKNHERIRALCRSRHPDYQARILMEGAQAGGIPFLRFLPSSKYWQFGWGTRARLFFESMSNEDGALGYVLQQSKAKAKAVFRTLGFPSPHHEIVNESKELPDAVSRVGWPCVVKPLSMGGGRGVTAGIISLSALEAAFIDARKYTDGPVMVEAYVPGDVYRLMVTDGKFHAALRREPPAVSGDGLSTVSELLDRLNSNRSENLVRSSYLCPIAKDAVLLEHLARQGVDFDSVPNEGRRITFRDLAYLSTGGLCIDVTERVHDDVKQMALMISATMGLYAAGIDYITSDIEESWLTGGQLIEINTIPGINAMTAAGKDSVDVARAMLGDKPGRIPFYLVVASRESIEGACRLLRQMDIDEHTGWTCADEAATGRMQLYVDTSMPWAGIRALLRNRTVSRIIALCSAQDVMRLGLPVDRVELLALCGSLPFIDEWLEVLEECSGTVECFHDYSEALRALFP